MEIFLIYYILPGGGDCLQLEGRFAGLTLGPNIIWGWTRARAMSFFAGSCLLWDQMRKACIWPLDFLSFQLPAYNLLVNVLKNDVSYGQVLLRWLPYVSIMITDIYNEVTVVTYIINAVGEAKGWANYPVPIQNGSGASGTTLVVYSHNLGKLEGNHWCPVENRQGR